MEIGIDIEQNERFKNMESFKLSKIFTKNEILYAQKFADPEKHFCAFWCVKESLVKALSVKTLKFNQIEVSHDKNGKPSIVMTSSLKELFASKGFSSIKVSLSHSRDYSTAVCLIY